MGWRARGGVWKGCGFWDRSVGELVLTLQFLPCNAYMLFSKNRHFN